MTRTRVASVEDAEAIARMNNEGIADRLATFETDRVIVQRLIGEAAS